MTTLDRYFLGRMALTYVKVLAVLVGLYIFIDLLSTRRGSIVEHNVPLDIVVWYYIGYAPRLIYLWSPIALLLAGLMVAGDAAEHNEVTAALAGGISMRRLTRMLVAGALGCALLIFALDQLAGAPAMKTVERIESNYFSDTPETNRRGVSWANLEGGWTCHILKFNRRAMKGEHVFIHTIREDAVEQISARRIYWDPEAAGGEGSWMLEDGKWLVFEPEVDLLRSSKRITQVPAPIQERPEELFALQEPADTKRVDTLARDIREAAQRGMPTAQYRADWHAKFAFPALNFVMIWLAIPFAMRVRRGGLAISFGLSLGIGISYLMVFGLFMALGRAGRIDPAIAAWMANVLYMALGLGLYARTPT